jgi:hypothetical protein
MVYDPKHMKIQPVKPPKVKNSPFKEKKVAALKLSKGGAVKK